MEFQSYATSLGFKPVAQPDIVPELDRERARQLRSEQAYLQGLRRNAQVEIENAKQFGRGLSAFGKGLGQLSKLSETLHNKMVEEEDRKNRELEEEGLMLAYTDGVPLEEQQQFEEQEAQLRDQGRQINQIASDAEASGDADPVTVNTIRGMSGHKAYGYQKGKVQLAASEYPIFYTQMSDTMSVDINGEAVTLSTAKTHAERAAVETEIRKAFLSQFRGVRPALLNKYLFKSMRTYEQTAALNWAKKREQDIQAQTKLDMQDELYAGLVSGNGGAAFLDMVNDRAAEFGGPGASRKAAVAIVKELVETGNLTRDEVEDLLSYPFIARDGHSTTIGKMFGRDFAWVSEALDAQEKQDFQKSEEELRQIKVGFEREFNELYKQRLQSGEPLTNDDIDALHKKYSALTGDPDMPDYLKDVQTAEESDDEAAELELMAIKKSRGWLTENDFRGKSAAIWKKYGHLIEEGEKMNAPAVQENSKTAKRLINAFASQVTELTGSMSRDTVEYVKLTENALSDYNRRVQDYINGGLQPDEAHKKAIAEVEDNFFLDKIEAGKANKSAITYQNDEAVNIDTQYLEKLESSRGMMSNYSSSVFPGTDAELQQLETFIKNGTGTVPRLYHDLARSYPNLTGWDIARAQAKAAGLGDIAQPEVQDEVQTYDPDVQRLLNYRPSPRRTQRAGVSTQNSYRSSDPRGASLIAMATRNGWDPADIAAIISFETGGTLDPGQPGYGAARGRVGLIQAGPNERAQYGLGTGNWDKEMQGIENYLKGRGAQPGMGIEDLYATVNGGNPGAGYTPDGNGTVARSPKTLRLLQEHRSAALSKLGMYGNTKNTFNSPVTLHPKLAYISGNIGPTSTGPHLDVKEVGGGNFAETALDEYVEVDDPEFGRVSLGEIRKRTGGIGDNQAQHRARGSHGVDYGLHSGTKVYVKNGAKVVGSRPSAHGDVVTIQLPNGKQYTFLHGKKAK